MKHVLIGLIIFLAGKLISCNDRTFLFKLLRLFSYAAQEVIARDFREEFTPPYQCFEAITREKFSHSLRIKLGKAGRTA